MLRQSIVGWNEESLADPALGEDHELSIAHLPKSHATRQSPLYATTFPCHNCAKHIIAAGIRRVVYLEPYPKSRANDLYREEIVLESIDGKEVPGQVVFSAYSGIAPRKYRQLFSMSERGAKQGMPLNNWNAGRRELSPLYVMRNGALAYVEAERQELGKLPSEIYKIG